MLRLGFEHFGLRRIVANLDARNDRSAALCERLGMRRETHRLGDFWSKGDLDRLLRVRPPRRGVAGRPRLTRDCRSVRRIWPPAPWSEGPRTAARAEGACG